MKRELARFAKRFTREPAKTPHWRGVFATARDVPVHGPGFAGDVWRDLTRSFTQRAIADARTPAALAAWRSETQILATVAALSRSSESVRVLDFGGGMGIGYVLLRGALGRAVAYHIVEDEQVCAEGTRLLADDPDVQFRPALPEAAERFDVVYACSSLQYIDDLDKLFAALVRTTPSYIVLADVPAGDIPTFWTAQLTVPGSAIAYKFMNLEELVETVRRVGYELLVRGVAERPIDTTSLPASHRLERTCNLVFGRRP